MNISTPSYTSTLVPHMYSIPSRDEFHTPLGVTIMHTPGHTPDEVALYDATEKMVYVGDTLYEHEQIIFPKEGSIVAWLSSIDYLVSFVTRENGPQQGKHGAERKVVLINAGHRTVMRPALDVLVSSRAFIVDVLEGREPVRQRSKRRGEETVEYRQADGRFALRCPERLVLEAQDLLMTPR